MEIIAQIVGIIGSGIAISSYQLRSNRKVILVQSISSLTFALSFLLLGIPTPALLSIIAFVRNGFFYLGDKYRKPFFFIIFNVAFILATVFTSDGWISLLPMLAQITSSVAMWSDNGKFLRFAQLFVISPLWLIYNFAVFTIGGIICESFNIISTIISLFRFAKKGFEN